MKINPRTVGPSIVVQVAVLIALAVAAQPAFAQRGAPAPGTFLGAVLLTDDAPAASAFYAGLFGWDMEQAKDGGFSVNHKGRVIAGISPLDPKSSEAEESVWLVGLAVNDLEQSLRSAGENNARVYEKAERVGDYGHFAVIADRQKAPVMLIEPGKKPIGGERDAGSFVWAELWTDDVEDAVAFYTEVIGVEHRSDDRGGQLYDVLASQGKPRAGIVKIPVELEKVEPGWAPYVAVDDLGATLAEVKMLGGRVIFSQTEHPAQATVALIMDPSGAVLFLYQIGSSQEAAK
jgi:predicted enzyme related to lactoylglutathione lyase